MENLFASSVDYRVFLSAIAILLISEGIISFLALQGTQENNKAKADHGTVWLIIIGWWGSILAGTYCRSQLLPGFMRDWLCPYFIYYFGIVFITVGVIIRCNAVLTLKKAFTLSVQTTANQHLIQTGLYRIVRNPAYTGSIISLMGVSLSYRHILGILATILICMVCYSTRIKVEERVLKKQFPKEFEEYCDKTKYRLFPFFY
jgi:Putative protein-S-isoprenylcysteine methyltransferase